MLGYVRAYKPELKFREYDVYSGIYCSLCKQLAKRYSPFAQLFLSYDAAFLALVRLSLSDECAVFTKSRCCYNPMKRCHKCSSAVIAECADFSVIIFYYKLLDNIADKGFFKKLLSYLIFPAAYLMHKKAKRLRPEAEAAAAECFKKQAIAEKSDCSTDAAADSSAEALGKIMSAGTQGETREALYRFGYLLGRYVYVADAVDDIADDIKKHSFNPLTKKYLMFRENNDIDGFYKHAETLFNLNIGELINLFNGLKFRQYKDIVFNVLYYGLQNSAISILNKHNKQKEAQK